MALVITWVVNETPEMRRFTLIPLWFAVLATALADEKRPLNVLIFYVDDLGVMDVSPYNPGTFYDTPAIQSLADSGVVFTNGYSASPVCSPARSALMTGQWPARTRNTDFFGGPHQYFGQALPENTDPTAHGKLKQTRQRPVWPAPYLGQLAESHTTMAEAFKARGYTTFHAGKWHLGPEGSWPEDHGFDYNRGGHHGGGPYGGNKYFSPYGNPRLEDGPPGEHLTDRLATETANFIGKYKDQPFFAMLNFYAVHTPLIGRPDLVEKYTHRRKELGLTDKFEPEHPRENRSVQSHAIYAAMVEAVDQAVGKVLAALEKNGVADNTLVIFSSDHGGLSTSEGSPTTNLPHRAGKGWLYEGGLRVPVIVRWPGVSPKGAVSSWFVTGTDFYPTVLDAAGLPPLPAQHKDGVSFAPALKRPAATSTDRDLYWHYPHWGNQGGIPGAAIRRGDWKFIQHFWGKAPELYHLGNDPGERHNLALDQPDVAMKLFQALNHFHRDTDALMPKLNPDAPGDFQKW